MRRLVPLFTLLLGVSVYGAEDVRSKLRIEGTSGPLPGPVNVLKLPDSAITVNGDGSLTLNVIGSGSAASLTSTNTWDAPQTWEAPATFTDDDFSVNSPALVANGGLLGLGTANPLTALHVYSGVTHTTVTIETAPGEIGDASLLIRSGARARIVLDGDNDGNSNEVDIQFRRGNQTRGVIGWADVNGGATGGISFNSTAGGNITSPEIHMQGARFGIGTTNLTGNGGINLAVVGAGAIGTNYSDLSQGAVSSADGLAVEGNLGVGVRVPTSKLQVAGHGLFKSDTSTVTYKAGGIIKTFSTTQPTVGTSEEILYTYTLPANTLDTDGQCIHIVAIATTAANANNKTIQLNFGSDGVAIMSALAENGGGFWVEARIWRVSANTVKTFGYIASTNSGQRGLRIFTRTVTLSGAIVITLRGTTPTSAGDLTAEYMQIDLEN